MATPYYVLMSGTNRIGPTMQRLPSDSECAVLYAFSGKESYDAFCDKSDEDLRPYPLVKGYLQGQIDTAVEPGIEPTLLRLVVIDAAGPQDEILHAATMQSVLKAQKARTTQLPETHQLTFNRTTGDYRLHTAIC